MLYLDDRFYTSWSSVKTGCEAKLHPWNLDTLVCQRDVKQESEYTLRCHRASVIVDHDMFMTNHHIVFSLEA